MTLLSDSQVREKIEHNSIPEPNSGCWLWTRFVDAKTGYGRVSTGSSPSGAAEFAHRASYRSHKGPIPAGMQVCHKCDVRSCVNPDHLFAGTATDNMSDAARKGRMNWRPGEKRRLPSGETHHQAKLTAEQVREIRSSPLTGMALARQFNISNVNICRIRRGVIWRDVN